MGTADDASELRLATAALATAARNLVSAYRNLGHDVWRSFSIPYQANAVLGGLLLLSTGLNIAGFVLNSRRARPAADDEPRHPAPAVHGDSETPGSKPGASPGASPTSARAPAHAPARAPATTGAAAPRLPPLPSSPPRSSVQRLGRASSIPEDGAVEHGHGGLEHGRAPSNRGLKLAVRRPSVATTAASVVVGGGGAQGVRRSARRESLWGADDQEQLLEGAMGSISVTHQVGCLPM